MDRTSDDALVALLLTQRLVDVGADPLPAGRFWALVQAVPALGGLLGLDRDGVVSVTGLDPDIADRVVRRIEAEAAVTFALDDFRQGGFRTLTAFDDQYPSALMERLGRAAPPLLYLAGDPDLLAGPLVGVVGSRNVGPAEATFAEELVVEAVAHGHGLVSGGARGVDRTAMDAAFVRGAPVVGVLADSLIKAVRDAEVRRAVLDGRTCLCTPYKPSAGFSVGNAMGRNKVVYALSATTVVVATQEGAGGTWAGAIEALEGGFAPVAVWTGDGSPVDNQALLRHGARGLTSPADLFPLAAAVARPAGWDDDGADRQTGDAQLGLWS